jgi:UDP:flavonoid glycosyltransferase YjiC (YdhE family)
VLSSEAFDFPADGMPANLRYAGPLFDDPAWAQPWTAPAGDEPLVLVALSTTFQDHERTLQRIIGEAIRADAERGAAVQELDALTTARAREVRSRAARAAPAMSHGAHIG